MSDQENGNYLSTKTINTVYICFSVLAAVGICVLVVLRKPVTKRAESSDVKKENIWSNLVSTFSKKIYYSIQILLLFIKLTLFLQYV